MFVICYLTHPHWEVLEHIPSTNIVGYKFVRGTLASLKSSVITLLCRPDMIVGTAVTQLGNINAMESLNPKVAGAKWWHSAAKGKVGMVIITDSRVGAAIRVV